jgi:hypothetical protein
MGQIDALNALKNLCKIEDRWYVSREIENYMRKNGCSNGTCHNLSGDLLKLAMFGQIEIRGVGVWQHYKEYHYTHPTNGTNGHSKKEKHAVK